MDTNLQTGASGPGNPAPGYDIGEVNILIDGICASYNKIGSAMTGNWNAFHTTFQNNWVGPDADDNENDLIDNIYHVFAKCQEGITMLADRVKAVGDFWVKFEEGNVAKGGHITGSVEQVHQVKVEEFVLQNVIKRNEPQDWSLKKGVKLGLKDFDAAKNISGALDTYVDEIYRATNEYYATFNENKAFFGSQKESFETYVKRMSDGIAKLTTCHKSLREMLQRMAQNWIDADVEAGNIIQNDADTASERFDYKDENLK